MSSSIPPKGSDVVNEKLREMGAGTAKGHHSDATSNHGRSTDSRDHVNSTLAGGMTIGPPIDGNQVNK